MLNKFSILLLLAHTVSLILSSAAHWPLRPHFRDQKAPPDIFQTITSLCPVNLPLLLLQQDFCARWRGAPGEAGGGYLTELVLTPFTVQRLHLGSAEERSAARVERTVLAMKRRRRRLRRGDSEEDSLSTSGVGRRSRTHTPMFLKCNAVGAPSFSHHSVPRFPLQWRALNGPEPNNIAILFVSLLVRLLRVSSHDLICSFSWWNLSAIGITAFTKVCS